MKEYKFNIIYRDKNGEFLDDRNIWIYANSKSEAIYILKEEYPKVSEFVFLGEF